MSINQQISKIDANISTINNSVSDITNKIDSLQITKDELHLKLDSLLTNLDSKIKTDNDKFSVKIDNNGVFRVLANVNPKYNGNIELFRDGRLVINCDDIQSGIYTLTLFKALMQPIDTGLWTKGILGDCQTYQSFGNGVPIDNGKIIYGYVKYRLKKLEIDNKIPSLILSLAVAYKNAFIDAYNLLDTKFKTYVDFTNNDILDFVVFILLPNTDTEVIIGTDIEIRHWIDLIKSVNGIDNSVVSVDLGINNTLNAGGMSNFINIGRDLLTDGKGVSIGSNHWYNSGLYNINYVYFNLKNDNRSLLITFFNISLFTAFGFSNEFCEYSAGTVGDKFDKAYLRLKLNDTGTHYYIGNVLYPIDFEGPINIPLTVNNVKKNYCLTYPTCKYGPFIAMNTSTNNLTLKGLRSNYTLKPGYAICVIDYYHPGFLEIIEEDLKGAFKVKSIEDYQKLKQRYASATFGFSHGNSCLDLNGNITTHDHETPLRVDIDYCKKLEQNIWNPKTNEDINLINYFPNWYAKRVFNGSDINVFTSFIVGKSGLDKTEYSNSDNLPIVQDVLQSYNQHSNTPYINNYYLQKPVLERAVIHTQPAITFLLENIGIINGVAGSLEATRANSLDNYFAAMRQIQMYGIMRVKDYWNHAAVLHRINLMKYNPLTGLFIEQNLDTFKKLGKMTQEQAKNIIFDCAGYLPMTFFSDLAKYLVNAVKTIDWTKPYFNQTSTTVASVKVGNYDTVPHKVNFVQSTYQGLKTQIEGCINQVVALLQNFDLYKMYELDTKGTFTIITMIYRAMNRHNVIKKNFVARIQNANNIFTGKDLFTSTDIYDGYSNDSISVGFLQAICSNEFKLEHVLVNFTYNNGVYTKVRELTDDDRLRIFINRLTYPYGFDGNKVYKNADPSNNLHPKTVGELFVDALIDTLVDFSQLDDSWTLSYVNADMTTVTEVESKAVSLLEKASRTWSSVNTLVIPFDKDSLGKLRLYPIPFGQDRTYGTAMMLFYNGGNWTANALSGFKFNGNDVNLTVPDARIANDTVNGTSASRTIFAPGILGHNVQLYKNGYIKEVGGSCDIKVISTNNNKFDRFRGHSFGATDCLTTYGYRGVFRIMNTKTIPDLVNAPKIATIDPKQYNRTQFKQSINVKPGTDDLL